ncbi:restriction endonuclease [Magnetospirillum sulfuroxidans]|uniref:Restriction endonuclease n=1 Tax=Magnetospirillum sulfuroxidans TaxID=611300 RepID=A0ABS5IDF4_9PROT|nr:restriction endonuclease [Magnetospirillum sulfuroxidans]MBR9972444.1 restriction endonuclease [Magnetospirillum sulfuroxidans]
MTEVLSYKYATEYRFSYDDAFREERGLAALDSETGASLCKYCCGKMHAAFRSKPKKSVIGQQYPTNYSVDECLSCGWWRVDESTGSDSMGLFISRTVGELRRYDTSSISIPLDELRSHLRSNPKDLAWVNPTKFEKLMAACLRDAYSPCEVRHVGGSGDGGVDIILVTSSSEKYLVQVKRRADLSKKEGVSAVRELNGVLFREGECKGIVITTASGFTKSAKSETNIKTPTVGVYKVDLFDIADVVRLLGLDARPNKKPWELFVDDESAGFHYDSDEVGRYIIRT